MSTDRIFEDESSDLWLYAEEDELEKELAEEDDEEDNDDE